MNRRGSLTFGVLLILVGAWFLAVQFVPGLSQWVASFADWPFWVVGPGLLFLVAAIVSGVSGLAVPGAIISGIGSILYYQNETGDWESWAYAWTLIIASVGVGIFIMHLLDGNLKKAFKEGGDTFLVGAVMFLLFSSFFRYIFGQPNLLGEYWPVLIILWGAWLLLRPILFKHRSDMDF